MADGDASDSFKRRVLTEQDLAASKLYPRKFREINDENPDAPTLRVLQFNVLADCLATSMYDVKPDPSKVQPREDEQKSYEYRCPSDALQWSTRKHLLLEEITRYDPDIICLEEVDHFSDFFEPELRELGYAGVFEKKKASRDRKPRDGIAVFYRASRFAPLGKPHSVTLQLNSGLKGVHVGLVVPLQLVGCGSLVKDFIVACTHLKSGQFFEMEKIREEQLIFLCNEIASMRGDISSVLLCGDLNAQTFTVPNVKALMYPSLMRHKLGLKNAYTPVADAPNKPSQMPASFYTFYPGQVDTDVKATYDYIFHSRTLKPIRVLKTPRSIDIDHETRLPNANYPSDHFAICADFQFKQSGKGGKELSRSSTRSRSSATQDTQTAAAEPATSTGRLRPSWDVYNRLKWNAASLDIDLDDVFIGYRDSRRGDTEVSFHDFVPIKHGGDIPFHHVFYFRVASSGDAMTSKIIWHREKRIDLVFGSRNTS